MLEGGVGVEDAAVLVADGDRDRRVAEDHLVALVLGAGRAQCAGEAGAEATEDGVEGGAVAGAHPVEEPAQHGDRRGDHRGVGESELAQCAADPGGRRGVGNGIRELADQAVPDRGARWRRSALPW
ncbi:hypothetical protein [Nocardia sp. NPDC050717]|uniref:hypothetical protein n=1 Tax=Nocardia sp. NPDC050717 TaxID=3157221 RepID=UPI0033F6A943